MQHCFQIEIERKASRYLLLILRLAMLSLANSIPLSLQTNFSAKTTVLLRLITPRLCTYPYYFTLISVLFQLQQCYFTLLRLFQLNGDFTHTFLNGHFMWYIIIQVLSRHNTNPLQGNDMKKCYKKLFI